MQKTVLLHQPCGRLARRNSRLRYAAAPLALVMLISQPIAAYASIDNTVKVTAKAPDGSDIEEEADETVDVVDDNPGITVVKSAAFAVPADDADGDGKGDNGDKLTYTYRVTNSGNVTLTNVSVSDDHDGVGAGLSPREAAAVDTDSGSAAAGTLNDSSDGTANDGVWDTLGPGDVIVFTATYDVITGDLNAAGSGTGTSFRGVAEPDGWLDNTATASGTYGSGPSAVTVNDDDTRSVELDVAPSLLITKIADDDTEVVAGQVITYTYTVTNNGNVAITNVQLSDTHKGVLGALTPAFDSFTTNTGSTNTGNTIDILQPGDVAVYKATYTVTQDDVESLQ